MKRKDAVNELKKLSKEELTKRLTDSEEELMKLRFRHVGGQLAQTSQLGVLRRRIARAKTLLNQNPA